MIQMLYYTVNWPIVLLFLGSLVTLPSAAQQIVNVRPLTRQDTIILTYDIIETQPGQQFKIKAYCWNGYEEIELKSVSGQTIVGRGTHKLAWNVLSDVDVLAGDSITFTIVGFVPDGVGKSVQEQKILLLPQLTGKVDLYLEQLYNQALLFGDFAERPFESNSGYAKLDEQTKHSNKAYEDLLMHRRSFEATIESLWGSSAGKASKDFFQDLFEGAHQNIMTSYNDILKMMNDVVHRNYRGQNRKSLLRDIQERIYNLTKNAADKRRQNKIKAEILYQQLPL